MFMFKDVSLNVISITACLLVITPLRSVKSQYYNSAEEDGDDGHYEETPNQDYTKYYNQGFGPLGQLSETPNQENGAGFVTPLDFSGLFSNGQFGLGLGASNVNNVFKPPGDPTFGSIQAQSTNRINHTGFISPSESKSLFDIATSISDAGFGSNDFISASNNAPFFNTPHEPKEEIVRYPSKTKLPKKYQPSAEDYSSGEYNSPTESEEYENPTEAYSTTSQGSLSPITLNTLSAKPQYYPQKPLGYNRNQPYQKFSFQPSGQYHDPLSTTVPSDKIYPTVGSQSVLSPIHRPEDAERVPRKICRKIEKDYSKESLDGGSMTCFICKDAKSEETYEQCSYTSKPNNEQYFSGQKYRESTPTSSFRYKRYASKQVRKERYDSEYPAESKNYKYKSQPKEFLGAASYKSPNFEEYEESRDEKTYDDPNYYSFDPIIESYAAEQSKQVKQDGGNCKKVDKEGGMTCMVCENPKTGGSFEQCSYTSKPTENKYAFTKEKKYDSNDDETPEEVQEEEPEQTEEKKFVKPARQSRQRSRKSRPKNECKEVKKDNLLCKVCKDLKTGAQSEQCSYSSEPTPQKYAYQNTRTYGNKKKKPAEEDESGEYSEIVPVFAASEDSERVQEEGGEEDDDSPAHFEEDVKQQQKPTKHGGEGLNPDLYGSPLEYHKNENSTDDKKEESSDETESSLSYEDYFAKIFPEYASIKEEEAEEAEGTENKETNLEDYFGSDSKQRIEQVLADFAKKDRSNCTQKTKDNLTCYRCTDENGIKNEECMYLTESQPEASHKAYHQVQKFESKPEEQVLTTTEVAESSVTQEVIITPEPKTKSKRKLNKLNRLKRKKSDKESRRKRSVSDKKEDKSKGVDEEPAFEKPAEFDVEGADGAFATELRPVYSKKLGLTLPAFMLTKSDHEASYDEAVASGK